MNITMSKFRALRYKNRLSQKNRIGRALWGLANALLIQPTPRWALHGWRRCLLRLFGATIGEGCRIDPTARIWAPWNLKLGDYVALAEGCQVYNVAPIVIGSKVAISQRCFLCTASHDIGSLQRPLTFAPIHIGNHAWVAAEALVHPGVTIGEGAVLAARGVLRRSAPDWTIWAGNPAIQVGLRKVEGSPAPGSSRPSSDETSRSN